eukprot:m.72155 g.72155  ORF g.72155 m.72155 type:complete len:129 (+) comp24429_c2_seq1:190-576(+)
MSWWSSKPEIKKREAPSQQDVLTKLANCLEKNGFALHGTDWCGWCPKQLEMFGDAKTKVPYVDCSRTDGVRGFSKACLNKGIRVVPSWTTGEGEVLVGTQQLLELSKLCDCPELDLGDLIRAIDAQAK